MRLQIISFIALLCYSSILNADPAPRKVIELEARNYNTCVITDEHKLYCWGKNSTGQNGTGDFINNFYPSRTGNDLTDVILVREGDFYDQAHLCAIKADRRNNGELENFGDLYCWGWNKYKQASSTEEKRLNTPVLVQFFSNNNKKIRDVSLGSEHTCALTTDDQLYCWGLNTAGQVGSISEDGRKTIDANVCYEIPQMILDNVRSVNAKYNTTCAVKNNGELYCWGDNRNGKVGNGTTVNQESPVKILDHISQVYLGNIHTCALTDIGDAYCFGNGAAGKLGNNSDRHQSSPVKVVFKEDQEVQSFRKLSLGNKHSCAVTNDNDLYCWGYNNYGQVGSKDEEEVCNGTSQYECHKVPKFILSDVYDVVAGTDRTCAIKNSGELYCWGDNSKWALGVGEAEREYTPRKVALSNVQNVGMGDGHTCARTSSGNLYCFGFNTQGQLGNDQPPYSANPLETILDEEASDVSLGMYYGCIRTNSRKLFCFGNNNYGQIGDGTRINASIPVQIMADKNIERSVIGQTHACAITSEDSNNLYCWGNNDCKQVSENSTLQITPYNILGALKDGKRVLDGKKIKDVALGYQFTYAVTSDDKLYFWGSGAFADSKCSNADIKATIVNAAEEVPLSLDDDETITEISSSLYHGCLITNKGNLYCFGNCQYGRLGNGKYDRDTNDCNQMIPERVQFPNDERVSDVTYGLLHTCAVTVNGNLYCFGQNSEYQVGTNTQTCKEYKDDSSNICSKNLYCTIKDCSENNTSSECKMSQCTNEWYVLDGNNNKICKEKRNKKGNETQCLKGKDYCDLSGCQESYLTTNRHIPYKVDITSEVTKRDLSGAWKKVYAGTKHTCAITADRSSVATKDKNALYCFGSNAEGQTGSGSDIDKELPVFIARPVEMVHTGHVHTCFIMKNDNGKLHCYGKNDYGELGYGHLEPVRMYDESTTVMENVVGVSSNVDILEETTCATKNDGSVYCFGSNHSGMLGAGISNESMYPDMIFDGDAAPTPIITPTPVIIPTSSPVITPTPTSSPTLSDAPKIIKKTKKGKRLIYKLPNLDTFEAQYGSGIRYQVFLKIKGVKKVYKKYYKQKGRFVFKNLKAGKYILRYRVVKIVGKDRIPLTKWSRKIRIKVL